MRPLIYRTSGLDSRLLGNDEAIRTETCTTSFPQGQKTKNRNLKFVIPAKVGIQNAKSQETVFPISFRADEAGFPPARE
ncbi:hypothetical protein CIJ83_06175 [Neisseria meningitidis]|nr:hypothetical protein CCD89_10705 [Neisseria meningitidis]QEN68478.1 hypothetical protein CCD88_10705 [Neisseria meningitidis]QEN70624.1 hypothetical protein CCD86_10675 [Neisseria meningitidis]QEN72769.1 hypothetical protein CCD85_10630 [Neisseria meningitidis]RGB15557.1 hypothetical protein CIJ83_06175 [Neisseria meningitidis]